MAKKETRHEKYRKIALAIEEMTPGEVIAPTTLARKTGVHKNTLQDLMDLRDSLNGIGFETVRDGKGTLKSIHRVNETLDIKKEIRDLRKEQIDLKSLIEESLSKEKGRSV